MSFMILKPITVQVLYANAWNICMKLGEVLEKQKALFAAYISTLSPNTTY